MVNTFVGDLGARLRIMSGQITTTIKVSIAISAVATPGGVSSTFAGETLMVGWGTKKSYLLSGQITTTVRDSSTLIGTASLPTGLVLDIGDSVTYQAIRFTPKAVTASGLLTTTVKTSLSLAGLSTQSLGMGVDGEDTFLPTNEAVERNLMLSGKFTTTVKLSLNFGPGVANLWDMAPTDADLICSAGGDFNHKVWVTSGKISTTIKSSALVGGGSANLAGIDTSDLAGRLGLGAGGNSGMFGLILDNDFV